MRFVKSLFIGVIFFLAVFPAMGTVAAISNWDIGIILFTAGLSTIFFYFYNRQSVPLFLGPSFALMAMAVTVAKTLGPQFALGNMIATGVVYLLFALIIHLVGIQVVLRIFPPIVVGTMIIIIGAYLMPIAVQNCIKNWYVSFIALLAIITAYFILPRRLKIFSIFAGYFLGYLIAIPLGEVSLSAVNAAALLGLPDFQLPRFDPGAVISIGIVCAITLQLEHIGDVFAISGIARKDYYLSPGFHRTLSGNGIATIITAALGGIGVTAYSEASGAYVIHEDYDPIYVVIAGIIALVLAFIPKATVFLMTIPPAAVGAVMLVMFGLISSVGVRTLVIHRVNLSSGKNLLILAVMLSLGIGGAEISIGTFKLTGVSLAGIAGVILSLVLPAAVD
jgi:uracil permease